LSSLLVRLTTSKGPVTITSNDRLYHKVIIYSGLIIYLLRQKRSNMMTTIISVNTP